MFLIFFEKRALAMFFKKVSSVNDTFHGTMKKNKIVLDSR